MSTTIQDDGILNLDFVVDELRNFAKQVENPAARGAPGFYRSGVFASEDAIVEINKHGLLQGYFYVEGDRYALKGRITERFADDSTFQSLLRHDEDEVAKSIDAAFNHLEAREALTRISELWRVSESNCRLAEARSRVLLRRVAKPPKKPNHLPQINGDEIECEYDSRSLESVNQLLLSLDSGQVSKPTLKVGDNGNLILIWESEETSLFLEFETSDLAWPGVKVRYMSLPKHGPPQLTIFYNAMDLLVRLHQDWKKQ